MKSAENKKITIQIISVKLVRCLFIFFIILMVPVVSNLGWQKTKVVVYEKSITPKAMNPQSLKENNVAAEMEDSLPPFDGNDTERLFHPTIIKTAVRYQVDPALVKAIIMAESGYNPRAISKNGAVGLMQLMPETAQELNVEDVFNPKQNIDGGVRYLKQLMKQFSGDLNLALAAYNAGSKAVKQHKGVPPFKETRQYIKKVFEYYKLYKNQIKEGVDNA